jgi:hypothetical protein
MKLTAITISLLSILVLCSCESKKDSNDHSHEEKTPVVQGDTLKKSVPKEEHAKVGDAHVMIKYHAPAVRGRTIWGGLVPFGDVWVTGAHSATTIEIDKDFSMSGKEVPAGKYALFTIPGKDKWTVIINKNWEQHLADEYDAKDDVVRVDAIPQALETVQERLKYTITADEGNNAMLSIAWEQVKLAIPFSITDK